MFTHKFICTFVCVCFISLIWPINNTIQYYYKGDKGYINVNWNKHNKDGPTTEGEMFMIALPHQVTEDSVYLSKVGSLNHKATDILGGWPNVRIILLMAFFVTSRHPCLFIST